MSEQLIIRFTLNDEEWGAEVDASKLEKDREGTIKRLAQDMIEKTAKAGIAFSSFKPLDELASSVQMTVYEIEDRRHNQYIMRRESIRAELESLLQMRENARNRQDALQMAEIDRQLERLKQRI